MARIVKADTKELEQLGKDIVKAKFIMLGRLAERGRKHLSDEVPFKTGNLRQGVAPPEIDNKAMRATLTVSARSGGRGAGVAQVMNADGKLVKTVTLRPSPAYNYAEVVARGNKRPTLTPTHAKAFLIPVNVPPKGEGYLIIGGDYFIVRRSRKGQKANPFDERAARKLEAEMPRIATAVLEQFV
jgi:hypothetical protein